MVNKLIVNIDICISLLFNKHLAITSFYSYWVINFKK